MFFIGTIHLLSRAESNQIKEKILNNDFFTSIGEGTSHRSNSFTTVWNREHETIQRFGFEVDVSVTLKLLPELGDVWSDKPDKGKENRAQTTRARPRVHVTRQQTHLHGLMVR